MRRVLPPPPPCFSLDISPLPPHFVFYPSPTSSSHPSHLPRPSSPSPIMTWPSFYFIHPLHSPSFHPPTPLSSPLRIILSLYFIPFLLYPLPFFPFSSSSCSPLSCTVAFSFFPLSSFLSSSCPFYSCHILIPLRPASPPSSRSPCSFLIYILVFLLFL